MTSLAFLLLASSLAFTACGGDDGSDTTSDAIAIDAPTNPDARPTPTPDAASNVDAPPAAGRVMEVTCPATPDATVTTPGFNFAPMATTITVNQIVKFTTSPEHNVVPVTPTTDAGLAVGFGATKCLKFTAADTYHFKCAPHGFMGTITVN